MPPRNSATACRRREPCRRRSCSPGNATSLRTPSPLRSNVEEGSVSAVTSRYQDYKNATSLRTPSPLRSSRPRPPPDRSRSPDHRGSGRRAVVRPTVVPVVWSTPGTPTRGAALPTRVNGGSYHAQRLAWSNHYAVFASDTGDAAHPARGHLSFVRGAPSPQRHTVAPPHATCAPHRARLLTAIRAAWARRIRNEFCPPTVEWRFNRHGGVAMQSRSEEHTSELQS